jgi:hypothetical protein
MRFHLDDNCNNSTYYTLLMVAPSLHSSALEHSKVCTTMVLRLWTPMILNDLRVWGVGVWGCGGVGGVGGVGVWGCGGSGGCWVLSCGVTPYIRHSTDCTCCDFGHLRFYLKYQLLLQIPICYLECQNRYFEYQLLLQIPIVTSITNCYFQ